MKKILLSLLSLSVLSVYAIDPSGARVDFGNYGSSSGEGTLVLLIAIIFIAGFCLYTYIKSPKPKKPVKSEYEIMQERLEREEREKKEWIGLRNGCIINLIIGVIVFINVTGGTVDGFLSGLQDFIPIVIGLSVILGILWIKNMHS